MEAKIVAASGMKFAAIKAGKFRRDHFAGSIAKVFNLATLGPNARDGLRTVQGVADSLRVLRRFKPQVIFIKGGFVGVPVGIAAKLLRIPYIIHESDVTPGLANRLLGRWAERIAVGFPVKSYSDFEKSRLVFVGNPVRREIMSATRAQGLMHYKLDDSLPVLLVTGGSQGARQINDIVLDALPDLLERYQLIHQAGEGELERVQFELSRHKKLPHIGRYHPYAFIMKEMGLALAVADLVIGRAGVGTIADSAVLGKPTVLIPNSAMAGHQVANAKVLSRSGAARVLDGQTLTPEKFIREIDRIVGDREEQERLSKAIAQFANPEAAVELARVILAVGGEYSQNDEPVEAEPTEVENDQVGDR